jgi:hypothetical protein
MDKNADVGAWLKRVNWKRILKVTVPVFLGGAGLYLNNHINPTDVVTFKILAENLEGACAYGLVPAAPLFLGLLIKCHSEGEDEKEANPGGSYGSNTLETPTNAGNSCTCGHCGGNLTASTGETQNSPFH